MADDLIWDMTIALYAQVEHKLAAALQRQHGVGLSEYRALSHLSTAHNGELRMQELADKAGLNQSSVTRLVARLEGASFTYRDHCPNDRRGIYTIITEAGHRRYAEARTTYLRTLRTALDEAAEAAPALGALVAALRSTDYVARCPGGGGVSGRELTGRAAG